MRITAVTAKPLAAVSIPGPDGMARACSVELKTDTSLAGLSIAPLSALPHIEEIGRALLVGCEPRATVNLWQSMGSAIANAPGYATSAARAALDAAVWDLKSKANAEPLWKTLGGGRPRANAYASWTGPPPDENALGVWVTQLASKFGFRSARIPVAADTNADLRRLGLLERALSVSGGEPSLLLDFGGKWRPKDAIRRIRALESAFDLTWVQCPAAAGDFLGSRRVVDSVRAAVCEGRRLHAELSWLPYLHHQAANVIEIDVMLHGVSGALEIADAAFGFELPATLSAVPGNLHVQLAAAMPNLMSVEIVEVPTAGGMVSGDVRIENGWAVVGDAPGAGLESGRPSWVP